MKCYGDSNDDIASYKAFHAHRAKALASTATVHWGAYPPPLDFQQFIFYASLCRTTYKSMKVLSRVKCVRDFAYHSYES